MVTLDIEDNVINVLVTQGKNIKTFASEPLEEGLVKDGVILDPAAVAQKIKGLLQKNAIADKTVIASVSGVHSIYRVTRLPKIGGDLMNEAVRREMGRLIPVPLEDLQTSWQQIPVSGSESVVPMVGIPKETIDFTLSTLKQAGIESKSIDVRPLAIARVVDEKDALVINVRPFCFDIVLMIDGIPEIVRSLSFSESLVSPEEKVNEIKEELDRTINFYNNSKPAKPINNDFAAYISGSYKEILLESIHFQVKPLPNLFIVPEGFDADQYIVNMGLALKAGKPGSTPLRIDINVLPDIYLPKQVPVTSIAAWIFLFVGIGLLGLMVFNWQSAAIHNTALQVQINDLDQKIAVSMARKSDSDNIQAQIQKVQTDRIAIQSSLDAIALRRDIDTGALGEIIALMPGEITIKSIVYGNGWTVMGMTRSADIVLAYAYALQNSPKFKDIQLGSIGQTGFNQWEFAVTLRSR